MIVEGQRELTLTVDFSFYNRVDLCRGAARYFGPRLNFTPRPAMVFWDHPWSVHDRVYHIVLRSNRHRTPAEAPKSGWDLRIVLTIIPLTPPLYLCDKKVPALYTIMYWLKKKRPYVVLMPCQNNKNYEILTCKEYLCAFHNNAKSEFFPKL